MKKTILLLATVFTVGTSFAQYNNRQQGPQDKDYAYNKGRDDKFDKGYDKTYFFTAKDRDLQLFQINKDADRQIQMVKNKFFMMRMAKQRQIQLIEQKRSSDIAQVWAKYNDRNNKGDDKGGYGHGGRW